MMTQTRQQAIEAALKWASKSQHHSACPIARGKDIETISRNPCTCHVKAAKDALAMPEDGTVNPTWAEHLAANPHPAYLDIE